MRLWSSPEICGVSLPDSVTKLDGRLKKTILIHQIFQKREKTVDSI
ncbi:unnamed protein product [Acanthoscelides obtectus]|uniref:Uncharacterized protein n=1 Tax=Acanthoscelides obtectus TaxID=200917 RepID=A0A9P0JZ06_ACAOB|nr:unnamed protein product [Acanthoscelides obtectus]CAK1654186.1 hypothetical protein AOBTE_LOCUS18472 [Acanthoscelides obtectus]